ncbi:DUF2474 domain-containing protein [Rhizobiaceae bacterium]|nr:DUF2474 domain-containing protein [Rhizobiaceae bacterium]
MPTLQREDDHVEREAPRSWTERLLWFVGLWTASITVLGVIAYGIRFWLGLG